MAETESFQLELENPKRNVFVTQLAEDEAGVEAAPKRGSSLDTSSGVRQLPVIKESASKILENSPNTLQKTLLIKREVEVDRVQEELNRKRKEFRDRMERCAQRRIEIQKKQQMMKERVSKFDKFIKENEAKRRRAIQKYQTELRLKEQKTKEHEILFDQDDTLTKRHKYLEAKLAKYKQQEVYLHRVVDCMPENYLEMSDSMLHSLMDRYKTLSSTNRSLVENVTQMADSLETLRQKFEETIADHDQTRVTINSQLADLQKTQESKGEKNQELEIQLAVLKADFRAQRSEMGQIQMAIENIAEKCKRRHTGKQLEAMDLETKLGLMKDFLSERIAVSKMVQVLMREKPEKSEAEKAATAAEKTDPAAGASTKDKKKKEQPKREET